jgi:tRNA (guanine-N7-)-methyltransferase
MDWSSYYPAHVTPEDPILGNSTDAVASERDSTVIRRLVKDVEVADIGCGFGGLLVALAPKLPDQLLLGKTKLNYFKNQF